MKLVSINPPPAVKTKITIEFDEDEFRYMVAAVGAAPVIQVQRIAGTAVNPTAFYDNLNDIVRNQL